MTPKLISKGLATMPFSSVHTPSALTLSPMGVLTRNDSCMISWSKWNRFENKGVTIDKVDHGFNNA